jgi:hypothetical protein
MLTALLAAAGLAVQGQAAPRGIEPPTDQQVLRALGRPRAIVPFLVETYRDDIVVVKNRLTGRPASLFGVEVPVVASLWECVVYYRETVRLPAWANLSRPRTKTVYVDKRDVVR